MSNQSVSINSVKEARTNSGEGLPPGRSSTEQQGGPGRHRTTAKGSRRKKWSQEVNRIVMECYYSSNPEVVGYIERMHMTWKEKGMFDVKEQRLLDQKLQIVTEKWFSDLELNEIKERLMDVAKESVENGCEGSVEFGEEENVVCENECHVVLEDTCLNQDCYSNNDKSEVVTKLELNHDTVLKGDENEIFEQFIVFVYKKEKQQLKSLRGILKAKVKCAVNKVNCVLKKIDIRNLTELNNTMYAAAAYVTELVGANKLPETKKEPWWKRRLEGKLKELDRDLDLVNNLLEQRNIKKKHKDRLERRSNIQRKRLNIVKEEMKQRIAAVGAKIKRFNPRINQYQQNWMSINNQGRFFQRLNNEEENRQYEIPNSVEPQTFWRGIWSERKEHHKDAEWLKDVKKELEQDEGQDKIDITKDKMMRIMRKMPNWKAPGPDNVEGYWLKNLTQLHDTLVVYLQECLDSEVVPDWLTKG